ncbi:MAG TPA: hypothetical protein VGK61_09530 [Planctomycetota bacterium]
MTLRILILLLVGLQDPAPKESGKEIEALIDRLVETAEEDYGYGASWTGSKFSAVEETGQPGMALLDGKEPKGSPALRDLVRKGATALPLLMAHLDDARKTKVTVKHAAMLGGMFFDDEYDYNSRTAQAAPEGVNRNEFGSDRKHPSEHTLTVGDLCFVALGQIVNRQFNAIRYQPTLIIKVNSPTYSKALLAAVRKEWLDLTPEKHRESLVSDVRTPDSPYRREGAIQRLTYYYPEAAEKLVLDQLAKPAYCVFRVDDFVREKLYATDDPKEWKRLFEEWVKKEGAAFKEGLLLHLLEDVEACAEWKAEPGKVRAALFPGVDPAKPFYPEAVTQSDQARFIDALGRFHSSAGDAAVLELFKGLGQGRFVEHGDEYFALACMGYLIGRGQDGLFKEYCARRIPKSEHHAKELQEMLDRLNGGK